MQSTLEASNYSLAFPHDRQVRQAVKTNTSHFLDKPHRRFAAYAFNDRHDTRRKPEEYAELFDRPLNELIQGRTVVIGDPTVELDFPGVLTLDMCFLDNKPKHAQLIQATYPLSPFPNNFVDRVIDYNGVTRNTFGWMKKPDIHKTEELYQRDVSLIFDETLRILKHGGKGYFGSLYWLRNTNRNPGDKFRLFQNICREYQNSGMMEYTMIDDIHGEQNHHGYPKVSYLEIIKK